MQPISLHRFYVAELKHLYDDERTAVEALRKLAVPNGRPRPDGQEIPATAVGQGSRSANERVIRPAFRKRRLDAHVAGEFGGQPIKTRKSARPGSEIPEGRSVSKCVTTR